MEVVAVGQWLQVTLQIIYTEHVTHAGGHIIHILLFSNTYHSIFNIIHAISYPLQPARHDSSKCTIKNVLLPMLPGINLIHVIVHGNRCISSVASAPCAMRNRTRST